MFNKSHFLIKREIDVNNYNSKLNYKKNT